MENAKPFLIFFLVVAILFAPIFYFGIKADATAKKADETWRHWEQRGQGISRFHDDEKHVTCWTIYSGGSCIPDSQLTK